VEQQPGAGMSGRVDGATIRVGKRTLLSGMNGEAGAVRAVLDELAQDGKSTVVVLRDATLVGVLALSDRVRTDAPAVVARLKRLGVGEVVMLTGDHPLAAAVVAKQAGVDRVYAELLPEDKLAIVRDLAARHGTVAMIGDGVNDAPALAQATVGVAMGAAGADVAMETADVVLMGGDLAKLPTAVALSRFSRRLIAQNLLIAVGVICAVAPTTSRPDVLIVPAKTGSPATFSIGALSPVIGDWSTADAPDCTTPSTGTRSNGRTTTASPTATSPTGTVSVEPSGVTRWATSGAMWERASIARRARDSARCSPAAPRPNRNSSSAPSS
jgi:soluble P-type ATPase